MSNIRLILGSVSFRDFEVPSSIEFGGKQRLAVHQLASGSRVIDSMGPTEADISFEGIFSGLAAASRAMELDNLRAIGSPVGLIWDQFYYTVLIARFEARYTNRIWIPYRIVCSVVSDAATEARMAFPPLSATVTSDVSAAADLCFGLNIDLSAVEAALSMPHSTTVGSGSYRDAVTAMTHARAQMASELSAVEGVIAPLSFDMTVPLTAIVSTVFSLSTAAGQQAMLLRARALLDQAQLTLAGATT